MGNHKPINFIQLEDNISSAYSRFCECKDESSKTDLFLSIKELANIILLTDKTWKKYNLNYGEVSYEYALYLYERIDSGNFKPKGIWNAYIRKSLKVALPELLKGDPIWDSVVSLDDDIRLDDGGEEVEKINVRMDSKKQGSTIYEGLKLFYPESEINRLYSLASEAIYVDPDRPVAKNIPDDVRDFISVLLAVGKRILDISKINELKEGLSVKSLKGVIMSAMNAALLTLAALRFKILPRSVLLHMDVASLYRIMYDKPGATVTIKFPSFKKMEMGIAAASIASRMILEGKNFDTAFKEVEKEYDLAFGKKRRAKASLKKFVDKMIAVENIFGEDLESETLIDVLLSIVKILHNLSDHTPALVNEGMTSAETIKIFNELSRISGKVTGFLVETGKRVPREFLKNMA